MSYYELTKRLIESALFTADEIRRIVSTCGSASLGNAVVSCELLGIKLFGNDIDALFNIKRSE